jgi:hypothetical protein
MVGEALRAIAADEVDEIRIKNKNTATNAKAIECIFVLVFIYLLLYPNFDSFHYFY